MRICMVLSAPLPPTEGIGFYVWNLSRHLTDMGHRVQLITRGEAGPTRREKVEGITIWRMPFLPVYPLHVHLHGQFVRRLIRVLRPHTDVFHFHTPLVPPVDTGRPTLVTVHTPMKTDAGSIPADSLLGWMVKLQTPVSLHLEQRLFRRANRLTAVAHSVADELREYNIDPDDVAVLGNGVDTTIFTPGAGPDMRRPYILTAGRIAPRKGLEDLVRCAKIVTERAPEYRFLIAGAGPLEDELRAQIAGLGLEKTVFMLGHIADRSRMAQLYRDATAYVHAAHYEGLPTVLLEAMACGRPAVATAVSGALDVIKDGENGLLVPPHNPQQMAEAVLRLVDDPALGRRLGAAGLRTIETQYAWKIVSRSYLREYEALLRGVAA